MSEDVYFLNITGNLDAKGIGFCSRLENTPTGVKWTIRGNLAKAISRLLDAEKSAIQAENKALREASAPFAKIKPSTLFLADGSEAEPYSVILTEDCVHEDPAFTGKDLDNLRAALKTTGGEE